MNRRLTAIIGDEHLSRYGLTAVATAGLLFGLYYLLFVLRPAALGGDEATAVLLPPYAISAQGEGWELYFTNPQPDYDGRTLEGTVAEALIRHIDQAQTSIDAAVFEIDLTAVADALLQAQDRGVTVRIVTDVEHGLEANPRLFARLDAAGIPLRGLGYGALMHNKYWVFDGHTVWTGSTNVTENGIFANNNNTLVLSLPLVAGWYEQDFARLWRASAPPTVVERGQEIMLGGLGVAVLFAPQDAIAPRLVALVEEAQQSVEVMAFSFTLDGLGTAVAQRAAAGVEVRAIFETRGSQTPFSELTRLYCAGLDARQDGNPAAFHHKVLIIDGETVVTGSLNFSENATQRNYENVVIVRSAEIATLYQAEFARRWAQATIPNGAELDCP